MLLGAGWHWSHWEQGQTGLQAIFSYEVPKENSHYTLTYDSIPTPNPCSTTPQTFGTVVAYHGEMAIDPASGTILRLMLLADLKPDEFTVNSGIAVTPGLQRSLNDVVFENYHVLRSEMRIVHNASLRYARGDSRSPLRFVIAAVWWPTRQLPFRQHCARVLIACNC